MNYLVGKNVVAATIVLATLCDPWWAADAQTSYDTFLGRDALGVRQLCKDIRGENPYQPAPGDPPCVLADGSFYSDGSEGRSDSCELKPGQTKTCTRVWRTHTAIGYNAVHKSRASAYALGFGALALRLWEEVAVRHSEQRRQYVGPTGFGAFSLVSLRYGGRLLAFGANALASMVGSLETPMGRGDVAVGSASLGSNGVPESSSAADLPACLLGEGGIPPGWTHREQGRTAIGYSTLRKNRGTHSVALGYEAGKNDVFGSWNTYLGAFTGMQSECLVENAVAIGYGAQVAQSHTVVLGGTTDKPWYGTRVGIGVNRPQAKLQIASARQGHGASLILSKANVRGTHKSRDQPIVGHVRILFDQTDQALKLILPNGTPQAVRLELLEAQEVN